jgi:hypothetical protein
MVNEMVFNRLDDVKTWLRTTFAGDKLKNGIRPYKSYVATLSQSGTAAPTAGVLENAIPGTVSYTRTGVGVYTITANGQFPLNKVIAIAGQPTVGKVTITHAGTNTITINTYDAAGAAADVILSKTPIEIKIYP